MFDERVEMTTDKPVVFAPAARELVLLLAAVKANPLMVFFASNIYARHGYAAAQRFVMARTEKRPC